MKVTVLLFAGLKDAVGQERLEIEVANGADVGAVWSSFEEAYPAVETYRDRVAFAVEDRLVDAEVRLEEGVEIALLPPVSGG